MSRSFRLLLLIGSASAVWQPAAAAPIMVTNASFEDQKLADGTYVEGKFGAGWRSFNARNGVQNPTQAAFPSIPDGSNTAYINTYIDAGKNGFIYQAVTSSIAARTLYTLSVDVGWRADALEFADFAVQLVSGDPLGSHSILASGSFARSEISKGEFKTVTVSWESDAAIASPLSIVLAGFYTPGQGSPTRQVNFDNVRLDATAIAPAPEPASWAMMVIGFGLTGGAIRSARRPRVSFG